MKQCQQCKGGRFVNEKLKDHSGKNGGTLVDHIVICDMCLGKGYTTEEDHDRYLRSMGIYNEAKK